MWSHIEGHKRQIEDLKKALIAGRLPGAYLFTGLKGIGKRIVADAFACAVVCDSASASGDACGVCVACKKAQGGFHPDVFIVEPESQKASSKKKEEGDSQKTKQSVSENIKIEQIRDLQSKLVYHPLEARLKLAIIDEAEHMTESTANSLLKILEEPPASTHFILISTQPHMILPTIRSRCRHMTFQPISETIITRLVAEKKGLQEADALRIARLSGGSLGMAMSIEAEFINNAMGRFETLCARASSADIIETAQDWAGHDSADMRLLFDLLASWYRDILRYQAEGQTTVLINVNAVKAAGRIGAKTAEGALSTIAISRRALETTVNKQLMFENLLFTLTGC